MSMTSLEARDLLAWLLATVATLLFLMHLLASAKRRATSPSFPRPRGLPIIGNLHQIGALPHQSLAALAAKHAAPLMLLRLGSVPTLVISSAEATRAVFQYSDRAMSGRPALYALAKYAYGRQSISTSDPDEFWRGARRACLSELLGAPRVRGFRDARESEAAMLVAAVADASGAGSAVNLSHMVKATSSKILRRIAFGGDYNNDSMAARVVHVLKEAESVATLFWVVDYFPWLGWLDALRGLTRRMDESFHELDAFYERVIEAHLHNPKSSSSEEDLVDVLLRLHADPTQQSTFGTRSQIKGILTDIFVAGTDTSSATVEWTMTELVNNPDVLAKVQHEVRSIIGDDKDMVRESDLPRLTYLSQVIKESMRLHPPAPLLLPRETTEACTVGGCEVPANTRVLVNAKAIGMDTAAWGQDVAKFRPERHERADREEDGGGATTDASSELRPWHDGSFSLVPFGIKRRSCPGMHFGTAVVELLLANLLCSFDWRAVQLGRGVDVEETNGITVHRKNPLVLVAKRKGRVH